MRAIGQHSAATCEWGTSARMVTFARAVLGGRIDVDPASSPDWNRVIGAERIITKGQDGRKTPWMPGAPAPNELVAQRRHNRAERWTALVNSPGNKTGSLVAAFWTATAGYYELGWLTSAVWIGFSVEQLARLQRIGAASHPLEHVTLVPSRRLHYAKAPGVSGDQPGHASFVTLLHGGPAEVERFLVLGSEIGHVIIGDRARRCR